MDEPILTNEQKQELILLLSDSITVINNLIYNTAKKEFTVNSKDVICPIRSNVCLKCCIFNSIPSFNCSLCWFNWFINDYKSFSAVTNDDLKAMSINWIEHPNPNYQPFLPKNEVTKRDTYKCYPLIFKAIKENSKQLLIDTLTEMKLYLQGD